MIFCHCYTDLHLFQKDEWDDWWKEEHFDLQIGQHWNKLTGDVCKPYVFPGDRAGEMFAFAPVTHPINHDNRSLRKQPVC